MTYIYSENDYYIYIFNFIKYYIYLNIDEYLMSFQKTKG